MNNKNMHYTSMTLLWVGGLNWGLYGLLGIDLVQMVFGPSSLGSLVYLLIGAAAVYNFTKHKEECEVCKVKKTKGRKKK